MKCKHHSITIEQCEYFVSIHHVQDGKVISRKRETGEHSHIYIYCYDCKYRRIFSLEDPSMPKWVKEILEVIEPTPVENVVPMRRMRQN